jgi:formylglycine-generating enzyme required for sulfatase activity
MLSEYPRQQLKTLIIQFGRSICEDNRRCEAVLRDLCPDYKRETNLLIAALKEQVALDLLQSSLMPVNLRLNQLAQRLHDNLGIAEHFALWAVESWALALGVIQQPKFTKVQASEKLYTTVLQPSYPQTATKSTSLNLITSSLAKLFNANAVSYPDSGPDGIAYPAIFFHDKFKNGKPAIKMVRISGSSFMMGSPETETGRYTIERWHEVTIPDFIIGQYAVTFAEYDLFVKDSGWRKPADNGWGRGLRPVINVSWKDAIGYAAWLSEQTGFSYRLPTEAEWEYACRAGTDTPFSTGEFINTDQANFNGSLDYGSKTQIGENRQQTIEVGSFAANQFGLYDMHGNVWEWTASTYSENYNGEELRCFDPEADTYRMLRGGSWINTKRSLRSASRIRRDANDSADFIGFRLARDV